MDTPLYLTIALLVVIASAVFVVALALPLLFLAAGNLRQAANWLQRYFRIDMGFYSPFDLVYLYIKTDRLDEITGKYRKYQRKGSVGSEYFVEAWVAAHKGDWQAASRAHKELRKYTIMNDVSLPKLAKAIEDQDARQIDDMYLIDMGARATISPSFIRIVSALFGIALSVAAVLLLAMWLVKDLLYIA